jgi:Protein of unknown function (DUF3300)
VHSALRILAAVAIALRLLLMQAAAQQPAVPQQPVAAQQPEPANPPAFKPEQLDQLLAPIALYPDELIAQILTAATYPLEIVMAERWVADPKNAALTGDALAKALEGQSWDASVKSLVPFPSVLKMMSDQLDWTQQLGDAFLGQGQDCLASVQRLRHKAQAAGTLKSTPQQTVTVQAPAAVAPPSGAPATMATVTEEPIIAIEPTDPQQVYVPYYDPATAYGAWPYPDYQPYAFPAPVGYGITAGLATGLAFGAGVAVVGSLWGWGRPNWGGGNVTINSNQFNRINLNRNVVSGNTWQHNAVHRQGVAYRDTATSQRYGRATTGAAARGNYRGYAGQGAGAAAGRAGGVATAAAARPAAQARVAATRPAAQNRVAAARPAAQNRVASAHPGGQGPAARPGAQTGRQALAQHPNIAASRGAGSAGAGAAQRSAFNPGNGAQARASSQRGAASRQQITGRAQGGGVQRAGGGGFHGGGGHGGGGGARAAGGGFHGRR